MKPEKYRLASGARTRQLLGDDTLITITMTYGEWSAIISKDIGFRLSEQGQAVHASAIDGIADRIIEEAKKK